ncbi:MAG: phosphatidylinositol-specific phospholipase C [Bacteroidales bacterium]|nr:phosphatidylinositol-specific phospholipase C [Bacteroidales bacterium]
MAHVDDGISLNQITIPGTHDSGSDKHSSKVGWPEWHYVICHDFGIPNQLKLGVRWFDIRLAYDGGDLTLHHAKYDLHKNFKDVLNWSVDFLNEHPSEVVILMIKQEHSSASNHDFGGAVYNKMKDRGLHHFFLEDRVPTLGEARGKIYIVRRFQKPSGADFGIYTSWPDNTTGHYQIYNDVGFYVQDHYSLNTVSDNTKLVEILHCINLAHNEAYNNIFHLCFASGERVASAETLWETANGINPSLNLDLMIYPPFCKNCGVIMVNFAGGGDDNPRNCAPYLVEYIIYRNFGGVPY